MLCCHRDPDPTNDASSPHTPHMSSPPTRRTRRIAALVQWAVPIVALVLIPKCPACVAGYVLFFTGIGLSLSTAAAARWTLIALSITALVYLIARTTRRAIAHPSPR